MKHLAITAGLLLLVQAFHLVMLQYSTDTPRRTIDKSWLRELLKNTPASDNAAFAKVEHEYDQGINATEPSNDYSGGMPSGAMAEHTEEEENVVRQYNSENETFVVQNAVSTTSPMISENGTTQQPELPDATISMTPTAPDTTNSTRTNMREAEEERNSMMTAENSTSFQNHSHNTELRSTTLAPENNDTEAFTTSLDTDKGVTNSSGSANSTNSTGSTSTTAVKPTAAPGINKTDATPSCTRMTPSETSETSTVTTAAPLPNTPERANKTGKGVSSSDRGLEPDPYRSKRSVAWVAVLGTAAAVACVGLVAYILKKKRNGFSHRKLVEEYPSDPVLRLDNNEPLDLNFAGSAAYYNPGLQGDNIQMTNFPGRR